MAFSADNLKALGLSQAGFNQYYYSTSDDSLATVNTAGYFNNTDDNISMQAGDVIIVSASDIIGTLFVSSLSSGSVTTKLDRHLEQGTDESTSTNLANFGFSRVGGTIQEFTMDAPVAGVMKYIFCDSAGTGVTVVACGTGNISVFGTKGDSTVDLTFAAAGDAMVLRGKSTTEWEVVSTAGAASTQT